MKALCLYSSYVNGNGIPYYVRYYLNQLMPHFEKLVYITNERPLTDEARAFLRESGIELMTVANEGYDFGMWYKGIAKYIPESWDRVALINDSCILFKDLQADFRRIDESRGEYCGMVISDRYATHLQSFFLVINGPAIAVMVDYFNRHGLVTDYRQVIQTYEIGLTQEMLSKGMRIFSLYNNTSRAYPKNPSFALVGELIEEGMPLIKKKIVFRNYRGLEYYWVVRMNFDTDYRKYFKRIKAKYGVLDLDLNCLMADSPRKSHFDLFLFALARFIANCLRNVPGVRWLFHKLVFAYKKYFRGR